MLQQIQAGKLRALAHWGDKPLAALPTVPSIRSLGYPVEFAQWAALFAPAKTPEPIVMKLRAAAAHLAADPAFVQLVAKSGSPIDYQDAPAFQSYWNTDAKAMVEAVRRIGKVE